MTDLPHRSAAGVADSARGEVSLAGAVAVSIDEVQQVQQLPGAATIDKQQADGQLPSTPLEVTRTLDASLSLSSLRNRQHGSRRPSNSGVGGAAADSASPQLTRFEFICSFGECYNKLMERMRVKKKEDKNDSMCKLM